ncbi:MAG: polysaccharide biosynthesis/export family protein [Pirellulales bacterium]
MTEGKVMPLPQLSVSNRAVSGSGQSALKFSPAFPSPAPVALVAPGAADSFELRFRPTSAPATVSATLSSAAVTSTFTPTTAVPTPPVVAIAASPALPVAPAVPVARADSSTQQVPTELFAKPPIGQAQLFQPRIPLVVEHIPAPAPQHLDAQPVRAARETAPGNVAVPAGTELFASSAPRVPASVPPRWDLPALDYGAALRQVEPVQPPTMSARPIEPQRVVARELPSAAANMFGVGTPEPLLVQAPIERAPLAPVASLPPAQVAVPPAQAVVQQQPAPPVKSPTFTAPPQVVATTPVARPMVPAPAAVQAPARAQAPAETVVMATPKLPAAAELNFSNVPVTAEPAAPHFVAAEPARIASIAPAPAPLVQQKLVPASVTSPVQINPQPAYQPPQFASQPPAAAHQPAPIPPQPAPAPDRSRVVATADPQDPNTYTFSLATTHGQPPAMFANGSQPALAGEVGPESAQSAIPNAMPAPGGCNCGAYGQYGCPYLPGQSGTRALCGVDCGRCGSSCCSTWSDATCIPWALLGPGEYVGPARPAHVETYYLRVNDMLTLTFIESRKKSAEHYRIGVGDELQIEWLQGGNSSEKALDRNLLVQPDGTVTLPLIGEVAAAGKTVNDFRDEVVKLYSKYQRDPQITVTPLTVNVAVQDVLKAVTSKNASSGQTQDVRVTPEGTIQAAGIGSVFVQGLTLDELRSELEARYSEAFGPGLAVSPQLTERATSYVFLGGEVRKPGRYELEGPTTVMQAVALAGGWNNGGNLRQVVVFRRDENWCLKATKIDIRAPYYGKDPCPTNDIWLRDNDLVVVPKSCILCATDLIELYFTRGIYSVFPITYVYDFTQNSALVPVP